MQTIPSIVRVSAALGLAASLNLHAGVAKDLSLPSGEPNADEIAAQVYFVNHMYAVKNFAIEKKGKDITVIVNKSAGDRPTTNTVERYLNNNYSEGEVKAKDLAIFRSGKLRGTGMLITDYSDGDKSQSYAIWLPALRKIRRFAQPAHDDAWGGTDFTFGDVTLRKPEHETHELLGKTTLDDCLGAIELKENEHTKYTRGIPAPSCDHKGKEVYELKSTTKFENWWYDYRISLVDTKTFADYRSRYFKDGKEIKIIERDWGSMGLDDPRGQYWKYWYGKTYATNHETMAFIPREVVNWNIDKKDTFWSERTLRKIKR